MTHPESYCARCGGANVSWSAPSPLWNQVMRAGSINGLEMFDGIICLGCFVFLAEDMRIAYGWRLTATHVLADLEMVTPTGRIWDEAQFLWLEPPEEIA